MSDIQPKVTPDEPVEPVVVPDVAPQPHPVASVEPAPVKAEGGDGRLQDVLPQINEVAQKVGGFKKLADIAETLGDAGA